MTNPTVGSLIRDWRQRRRYSQLGLACLANISARHLSFMETGRAKPSRQMLLLLAEQLDIPLRQRNEMLLCAGYAPHYAEHAMDDVPLHEAHTAITTVLTAHEPFPAMAVDGHWNLVHANRSLSLLLADVAPELLTPPVNVLRLGLHPQGVASRILNLAQWRAHLLQRLRRQYEQTADPWLLALYDELESYPVPEGTAPFAHINHAIAVPLQLQTDEGVLSLLSATMTFGTPLEVALSELVLEIFLPANAGSAAILRNQAMFAEQMA
ncbi:helix-turn-helix domain-containing protein [Advenella kashmirensis]|nr:helix-turn-helix transcriptional regulator [Advenella kashmirensis]